jgi:radical S-adenosyl methionine domain-containing protein 2
MTKACSFSAEVTTVNYHLWKPCNMKCGFCFATFLDLPPSPSDHLAQPETLELLTLISQAGFRKVNFAGGEPGLCPWLPQLIRHAKGLGLTTSMVTNGSMVTDAWLDGLDGCLDILAISIDSADPGTLQRIGRAINGKPPMRRDHCLALGKAQRRGAYVSKSTP